MDLIPEKKATKTKRYTTSTPKKTSVYDFNPGPSTSSVNNPLCSSNATLIQLTNQPSTSPDLISNNGLSKIKEKKRSILSMICEAIKVVGLQTKGASYISIQKWIIKNRKTAQPSRLRTLIKKAIVKGLETELLKRSAFSKTAVGLQGYFIVNRKYSSENSTHIKSKKENLKLDRI